MTSRPTPGHAESGDLETLACTEAGPGHVLACPVLRAAAARPQEAHVIPATAPEPIVAPIIASPDAIKPATPPVNNASQAAVAPPVNAAAPMFPAVAPT